MLSAVKHKFKSGSWWCKFSSIIIPEIIGINGGWSSKIILWTNWTFLLISEPLKEHLDWYFELVVKKRRAHLGIVVDPDVDRLAFICDGEMFGEEYTLVACWLCFE
jgi:phosphomannomutase